MRDRKPRLQVPSVVSYPVGAPGSVKGTPLIAGSVETLLLTAVAASFIAQPTDVRVFSYPFSLSLMMLSALVCAFLRPSVLTLPMLFLLAPATVILIGWDLLVAGEQRALAFYSLLVFTLIFCRYRVPPVPLYRIWRTLGFSCLALTLLGAYRFFTGYEADLSEHVHGFSTAASFSYVYFGISYLPATRNSDALYFGVGALIFIWRVTSLGGRPSAVDFLALAVTLAGTFLSLSRGIWISVFVAVLLSYDVKKNLTCIVLAAIPLLLFLYSEGAFMLRLAGSALLSLWDPEAAAAGVHGFYSYSNRARLAIYGDSLGDILAFPFGRGMSYTPSYAVYTGATSVHSECMYLDMLLIFGVFSVPMIWGLLRYYRSLPAHGDPTSPLCRSVGLFLAIYATFNSGVDFAFFWFVLTVWLITVNSAQSPPQSKSPSGLFRLGRTTR